LVGRDDVLRLPSIAANAQRERAVGVEDLRGAVGHGAVLVRWIGVSLEHHAPEAIVGAVARLDRDARIVGAKYHVRDPLTTELVKMGGRRAARGVLQGRWIFEQSLRIEGNRIGEYFVVDVTV